MSTLDFWTNLNRRGIPTTQSLSWLSGKEGHYGMTIDTCKHLLAGGGPEDVEDSKRTSPIDTYVRILVKKGAKTIVSSETCYCNCSL